MTERWLPLTVAEGADALSAEQAALLVEADALLDRLRPPRLTKGYGAALDDRLYLVLPLDGVPHASLQLQMTRSDISIAWEDEHYVWDATNPGDELFNVRGVGTEGRAAALDRLEAELRRPLRRRSYGLAGWTLRQVWQHAGDVDRAAGWRISYSRLVVLGYIPRLPLTEDVPAGFLDPWTPPA